ncbi:hypothetical protein MJO28_001796 [Puccinia striiformis f. sp. tritici]|uniref:Uncharacterized protein n=1 Tax=Puccinia striiformis f. sp. tritici TaxID=168172 RepID=A0ACC0EV28_9BASI|nr:hypothetical protein MJO28_001796 [Puccinia striiformis f. sp. tritici]
MPNNPSRMAPRRENSRGAHIRSISLADENAPVNSLVGPQRSKAALLSKPSRIGTSGAISSSSKDTTHKSSSSVGGSIVPGRRVLGDVSNAVKATLPNKADQDGRDNKDASKPAKVRKVGSQASLHQTDAPAATFGGNAGKKVVATLKNRSSAQSLNSNGVSSKRQATQKASTSSSNTWASAAPKVLREELNEVEVIADHEDQIKLDDLEEVSHEFDQHHYDVRDEFMIIDPKEESDTYETEASSQTESKLSVKPDHDDFTSASEDDHNDEEHMADDASARVHSLQSDENDLSLCRSNVEELSDANASDNWLMLPVEEELECTQIIAAIRRDFQEELDFWDATMVAEYSEEIFKYMEELEESTLPNPRYMDAQTEIEWDMRTTLIDWLLQVHMRYHMLPETLWIAVNIIDRFLSKRVVSLVKFQLVGVTAMFVAAKYEEIMAPSVEEFVYMTENGYTRDDILKGEKILLSTLDYRISPYCSPYSWLRRISKADDYDIQTRTLSKFLMELTLLDHRFLRAKSSMIAAIGMYTARRMLGADWSDAFVFYSGYTEAQLITPMTFLIEFLSTDGFEDRFVYKKYANRKFLKASIFARNQALKRVREESGSPEA